MSENNLRGRVIAMYRSVQKFAKVIGWSNRKAYAIVGGTQEPTAKDIQKMCDVLNVELPEDFRLLFLTK